MRATTGQMPKQMFRVVCFVSMLILLELLMFDKHKSNEVAVGFGFETEVIFAFWTGNNTMGPERSACLQSLRAAFGQKLMLITKQNVTNFILKRYPVHPAFPYLSETHKSDYLRVYFMHYYGGGYTDVKMTSGNKTWVDAFNILKLNASLLLVGYPEVGAWATAGNNTIQQAWMSLVGNGAYVVRPMSNLTTAWLTQTHARLDSLFSRLQKNPAQHPRDVPGLKLHGKNASEYPVTWTYLLGDVFHPLVYEYRYYIRQSLQAPSFKNYRE